MPLAPIVSPEGWYALLWLVWGAAVIAAARLWLVNPVLARLDAVTHALTGGVEHGSRPRSDRARREAPCADESRDA